MHNIFRSPVMRTGAKTEFTLVCSLTRHLSYLGICGRKSCSRNVIFFSSFNEALNNIPTVSRLWNGVCSIYCAQLTGFRNLLNICEILQWECKQCVSSDGKTHYLLPSYTIVGTLVLAHSRNFTSNCNTLFLDWFAN